MKWDGYWMTDEFVPGIESSTVPGRKYWKTNHHAFYMKEEHR